MRYSLLLFCMPLGFASCWLKLWQQQQQQLQQQHSSLCWMVPLPTTMG